MKKINAAVLFLLILFAVYSQQPDLTDDINVDDVTSDIVTAENAADDIDDNTDDVQIFYISALSKEDDPFAHYNPRLFWKSDNYQKTLIRNRNPFFFYR